MMRVAGGVIVAGGRVLIAQRKRGRREELKWEFPGGKVEPGETPEACLARELWEELEIETRVGALVGRSICVYPWATVELLAFWVELVAGEPRLHDHEDVRWVAPAELSGYDFAEADLPIVRAVMAAGSGAGA